MSDVNKEIALYPMSGDKVRFVSTAKLPIGGFETELHPIQDLHGYEYPWDAGAGKNKVPYPYDTPDGIYSGVEFTTVNEKIVASGTTTNSFVFNFGTVVLPAGDYLIAVDGTHTGCQFRARANGENIATINPANSLTLFTLLETTTVSFSLVRTTAIINIDTHFWCESGSTKTSFAPYSNICPIYGYDSMNIYVSPTPDITDETKVHTIEFPLRGRNLFNPNTATIGKYINVQLQELNSSDKSHSELIKIKPSTSYFMNGYAGTSYYSILALDEEMQPITGWYSGASKTEPFVATTPSNAVWVILNFNTSQLATMSFYESSTNEGYIPYEGRTVYEGTLTINEDGTGQIVSEMANVDLSTLNWSWQATWEAWYAPLPLSTRPKVTEVFNALSSIYLGYRLQGFFDVHTIVGFAKANASDNFIVRNGSTTEKPSGQLVYELTEPIIINLTVEQIETLIGYNYVWNNVGTTNIVFQYYTGGEGMAITFLDCWTYPKAKLDEMFKAVNDRLEALEEASDEASADSNAKTTLLETKEATEPVAEVEREGDE